MRSKHNGRDIIFREKETESIERERPSLRKPCIYHMNPVGLSPSVKQYEVVSLAANNREDGKVKLTITRQSGIFCVSIAIV